MPHTYGFPAGFIWGTATSSYQIEGAHDEGGRTPSIWDTFCRTPGKVLNGDTGDVACDHYHRFREDIALLVSLGVKHYRFSVAWPRVIPGGTGAVNERGLDFYEGLVDALIEAGITPWLTFYHWDLPQSLEDKGGWRSREVVAAFEAFCRAVLRRLGKKVRHYFTLNELWCTTVLGYKVGIHAPGAKEPQKVVNNTVHHCLLAHGAAVRAVRELSPGSVVGLVSNPAASVPVIETAEHIAAARRHWLAETAQFVAPTYLGRYPDAWLAEQGADAPDVRPGDGAAIAAPCDFHGINIYSGVFIAADDGPRGYKALPLPPMYPRADVQWLNIVPQGIYWAIRHNVEAYGEKRVLVTENGCCYPDQPDAAGEIIDLDRREYLRGQLAQVHRAVAEGLPVDGYFLWSLMDNFEWAEGFTKRFGMTYVDFATQKRTPKLSARWYAEVVRQNALV